MFQNKLQKDKKPQSSRDPPKRGMDLELLFSKYARLQRHKGSPVKLSLIDITKAYFNARPKSKPFLRLPEGMCRPSSKVGRLLVVLRGHVWGHITNAVSMEAQSLQPLHSRHTYAEPHVHHFGE